MTQIDGLSFTQLTNLNVIDNLYVEGAVLPDEAVAPLFLNSSHLPDTSPLHIQSGADVNDYTQLNACLFLLDAAGDEVWRIWAMDPDDSATDTDNLFIGVGSGENINPDMFGGTENTGCGTNTLPELVGANACSAFGARSQESNIGGSGDSSFGSASMRFITTGTNTAFGSNTMVLATTLSNSTVAGARALGAALIGDENVSIGVDTLATATGDFLTVIGDLAGNKIDTANGSIAIGAGAEPDPDIDDQINIGDVITGSINAVTPAIILALQLTDPMILGALWNDSGTLMVSAGP